MLRLLMSKDFAKIILRGLRLFNVKLGTCSIDNIPFIFQCQICDGD